MILTALGNHLWQSTLFIAMAGFLALILPLLGLAGGVNQISNPFLSPGRHGESSGMVSRIAGCE